MHRLRFQGRFFVLLGIALLVSVLIVPAFRPTKAVADVQDFTVNSFDATYGLDRSTPHGHMTVDEQISVHFNDYNHGILRAIPKSYNGHPLHVHIISITKPGGAAWPYTTSSQNGNLVAKIGDPNVTVTGDQSFDVRYSLDNVITFFGNHDELYWNVNGDQWLQDFNRVSAHVEFGNGVTPISTVSLQPRCYTGTLGSKEQSCTINLIAGSLTAVTTRQLSNGETLSFVTAFPKGAFAPYTWHDTLTEHLVDIIASLVSLVILGFAFRYWWKHGKDFKASGVIVPEYAPPKGIDVLRAGVLQDYKLDNRDITAMLIDLCIRGYMKIVETDTKELKVIKKTKTSLQLVKDDFSGLNSYEQQLLNQLFSPAQAGATIQLGTYSSGLQAVVEKIRKGVTQQLTDDGYFDGNPKSSGVRRLLVYAALIAVTCFISFADSQYIGASVSVLAGVAAIILLLLMPRRTVAGEQTNEYLKGLKLYISTAEKDRIKMQQSPNAPYAADAGAPVRTVELFEKLLPYAIIFRVEKQWAKEFADIYKTPPSWYAGNWSTFNAVVLTNSIMSTSTAMGQTFTAPSSSGASGFGGGAGGGGGGGGGGGW